MLELRVKKRQSRKAYYPLQALHSGCRWIQAMTSPGSPDIQTKNGWSKLLETRRRTPEVFLVPAAMFCIDRDTKFCDSLRSALATGGVKTIPLPAKSPNHKPSRNDGSAPSNRNAYPSSSCAGRTHCGALLPQTSDNPDKAVVRCSVNIASGVKYLRTCRMSFLTMREGSTRCSRPGSRFFRDVRWICLGVVRTGKLARIACLKAPGKF